MISKNIRYIIFLSIFSLILYISIVNVESMINNEKKFELEWDVIYEHNSPWQKIEFLERKEDNTFALFLNDEIQVHSEEYALSHYLQCSLVIEKYKPKNILILGGGDLIAASYCLNYDFVDNVTLVEIDSQVVKFAKENPIFRKITKNVSKDKRLTINIGDAINFIEKTQNNYDLIIEDVEIDFTTQKSNINMGTFLKNCIQKSKVYCGSVPEHRIIEKSSIINQAKKKEHSYKIVPKNAINKIFKEISFSIKDFEIIKPMINNKIVKICSYDYGKIYGIEAYILISEN